MFEAVNMQNEVSAHVIYHICNEVLECLFKLDFSEKVPTSMNYEGSRASFFSHFEYIMWNFFISFSVHESRWSDITIFSIRKLIQLLSSAGAVYGTYDAIRSKVKFILASSFAKA